MIASDIAGKVNSNSVIINKWSLLPDSPLVTQLIPLARTFHMVCALIVSKFSLLHIPLPILPIVGVCYSTGGVYLLN